MTQFRRSARSWPDPECQLSVPVGRAVLSIGLSGNSSVSSKPSPDTYILLLFLRKLHGRPSCALSRGHSGFLSSRRHQCCLYGQAQQVKPWWKLQAAFLARSRERSEGFVGPAVWAKGNTATTELLTGNKCNKSLVYFFNSSNSVLMGLLWELLWGLKEPAASSQLMM